MFAPGNLGRVVCLQVLCKGSWWFPFRLHYIANCHSRQLAACWEVQKTPCWSPSQTQPLCKVTECTSEDVVWSIDLWWDTFQHAAECWSLPCALGEMHHALIRPVAIKLKGGHQLCSQRLAAPHMSTRPGKESAKASQRQKLQFHPCCAGLCFERFSKRAMRSLSRDSFIYVR